MKIVALIALMALGIPSIAQSLKAYRLSNTFPVNIDNGKIDKAVKKSLLLYEAHSPFLFDRFHNTISQDVKSNRNNYAFEYLNELNQGNFDEINQAVAPIHLWAKTIQASNANEYFESINDLNTLINADFNYNSRGERYYLLTLMELMNKKAVDKNEAQIILWSIIERLESQISTYEGQNNQEEIVSWTRYLLAFSYDYMYSHFSNQEKHLKLAAEYSPTIKGLKRGAYFYDAALLTGETKEIGYRSKYMTYLETGGKLHEAYSLQAEITFSDPTNDNLQTLKELHLKSNPSISFEEFWHDLFDSKAESVPKNRVSFSDEDFDFPIGSNSWIYIDVWATWCKPCLKELPQIQKLHNETIEDPNRKLIVKTFAYRSPNLHSFLNRESYTFPVKEISKEENDSFGISEYPTKILISPNGKFIKISSGKSWETYLKNYVLY